MAKATKEEVERRINFVYQQLIQQKSHQFILHYAAQKWGCKSRQVKTYISRAVELLAQEAAIARRDSFDEQLAIRRALFSKAYNDKNWRLCLDVLKDQCNLMNMYPSRIGELEAVKILVDANVVPVEVLEKISTALGQFQQSAIAAISQKDGYLPSGPNT